MYWWRRFYDMKTEEWEVAHSSLGKANAYAGYTRCRKYACIDISRRTWCNLKEGVKFFEFPKGTDFHFIGRVDTTRHGENPETYYQDFRERKYASFSVVNKENVSRYSKYGVFFIYNIMPDDIAHIFPMDSDTQRRAQDEEELCGLPSLWLTLNDLEKLTNHLGVYNQVTCKTKRNGQIIKPVAIASFGNIKGREVEAADKFGLPIVLCHPESYALCYQGDVLNDGVMLNSISSKLEKLYGLDVTCMEWDD